MSADMIRKMIDGLRDTAAKVEEMRELEEPDIEIMMRGYARHDGVATRTIREPRYQREWIAGRLLGMADMAEALMGDTPTNPNSRSGE